MKIKVLDLFCGMGGFSYGFSRSGYCVTGIDINEWVPKIFDKNKIGKAIIKNLKEDFVSELKPDIIVGGPPCKPWSTLNLKKRGIIHEDFILMERYFFHIFEIKPDIFIFENVIPIGKDETLRKFIKKLRIHGYSIFETRVRYSDFGAAIARDRYFAFGFYKNISARKNFEKLLLKSKRSPKTVRQAIEKYRIMKEKEFPDHEWPYLKTIRKYLDKYKSGKFGWYILDWNKPSPSFGNVMKTYILHPGFTNGGPERTISIRESAAIFGFGDDFSFPEGMGKGLRYQMIADAVSPDFSYLIGSLLKQIY